jgi:nucleotide-binding universal stress UspA family protein
MAIRDILIQVGGAPGEAARLAHALDFARRLGAGLTGAHIHAPRFADMTGSGGDMSWLAAPDLQRIVAEQEALETRAAAEARRLFESVAGAAAEGRWRTLDWSSEELLAQARLVDLVIAGPVSDPTLASPLSPDRLACAAGRPVLILPPDQPIGRRVLVAWNGGREAARALHDALPILSLAEAVSVISVETAEAHLGEDSDLKAHLSAHGISAKLVRRRGADPARLIREEARSFGADLLVMGVYGRSRVSEWVLGGVSRALLHEPALPVLISH